MVEIALCIAIIGFALVAIIGVLPTAMRVQQDNRSDTLIDQDGNYFMEAIRHGAQGLIEITNYVYEMSFVERNSQNLTDIATNLVFSYISSPPIPPNSPQSVIGALSVPLGFLPPKDDPYFVIRAEAKVHAISGSAVEKDPTSLINFDYLLTTEISSFTNYYTATTFGLASTNDFNAIEKEMGQDLHEVRLTFRWPLWSNGKTGNNKKVFRGLVSGRLVKTTNEFPFFEARNFSGSVP